MTAEHGIDVRVPFVGRAEQIELALALMQTGGIVTLVGPGGSGKSRMALELAHRFAGEAFSFVPLLESQIGTVADTLAAALVARESAGQGALDGAVANLQAKPRLVLIDNAEHVLAEAHQAVAAIAAVEGVVVLVTSRRRLGVPGEAVVEVGTMSTADATTFFLANVRTRVPEFTPDARELNSIERIVSSLDGLPFAIDLAAARFPANSLGQLVETARRILPAELKATASSDARHWTLQQTIDWSTSLLSVDARDALACLTTFNARFDAQDARALIAPDAPVEFTQDVLAELADHSLIVRMPENHYALLAPIRAAARALLTAAPQRKLVGKRFAGRMRAVANEIRGRIEVSSWLDGIDAIAQRYTDFRAVLEWSLKSPDRLPLGVEISWLLVARWADGGHLGEGMNWTRRLTEAAQLSGVLDSHSLAKLWYSRVRVCVLAADYATLLHHASFLVGAFTVANDQLSLGRAYNALAVASLYSGDLANAQHYSDMAVRLHTAMGHSRGVAAALCNKGSIELELRNRPAEALEFYLESEQISRADAGSQGLLITLLGNLAETYYALEQHANVEQVGGEGLALAKALNNSAYQAWIQATLGRSRLGSGDRLGARAAYEEALELLDVTSQPEYLAATVEGVARYVLTEGRPDEAARLIQAVAGHRDRFKLLTFGPTVEEAHRTAEQARDLLSREDWVAALQAGDKLTSSELRATARAALVGAPIRRP